MQMTRRWFTQALREYVPYAWEVPPADARFRIPVHYALMNRDRFATALLVGASHFPNAPFTVLDLGPYPGTFLRLLRRLLPAEQCRLIGAGLSVTPDFLAAMRRDCDADIFTVNLDPRNSQLSGGDYPEHVPLGDGSVQFVFALEVIEHLVSPTHLLREAYRVLAGGGRFLLTTPNVSRIGNIFKLAAGRTNLDRLAPLDYHDPRAEWRPHAREYAMGELCGLLQRTGFRICQRRFFVGRDGLYRAKSARQRLVDLAKVPFYAVPHFRGGLLIVAEKGAGGPA
jgi:SAM-dependent methyltransferase